MIVHFISEERNDFKTDPPQSVIHRLAAVASSGSLKEIQNLRAYPRPYKSESALKNFF